RQVDPEGCVRYALAEERQHDEARDDERPIADAIDAAHAAADCSSEHDKVQRCRQHGGGDALHQRTEGPCHLEAVDCGDRGYVHVRVLTRLTKISSSELSLECRSLKLISSRRGASAAWRCRFPCSV